MGNLFVLIFALVSLSVAYIIVFNRSDTTAVGSDCSVPNVVGVSYTLYHVTVGAVGGAMAFVPTLASFIFFNRRKKVMENFEHSYSAAFKQSINKTLKIAKLLLVLAFLDLTLVAVQNILQILFLKNIVTISWLQGWLLQLQCLRGSLNLFIYIFTNDEFRAAVLKTVKIRKINPVSAIQVNVRTVSRFNHNKA